ncbi:MAG: DUF357 domain-containing protein [archaeon]
MVQIRIGIKEAARKEISRMARIIPKVKLASENLEAEKVLLLANFYFSDSKHFLERGAFVEAFEAAVISWGYVDAGLHLGAFSVPEEEKGNFTVG